MTRFAGFVRSKALCSSMVVAVVLAVLLELRSHETIRDMSAAFMQSLKLQSIAAMEQREHSYLEREADHDGLAAKQAQNQAQMYAYRSEVDATMAERARKRGHYFEAIATEEEKEADVVWADIQQENATRVELEANLTKDYQEATVLEEKYREVASRTPRMCNWGWVFGGACHIVGGAPGLAHRIEDDKRSKIAQIVHETEALDAVETTEFVEELVDALLLYMANQDNETAIDLFLVAALLDERSVQDQNAGDERAEAAESLLAEHERVEAMVRKNESWEKNNTANAETLWSNAEDLGRKAYRLSIGASLLSICSLFFFLPRILVTASSLVQGSHRTSYGGTRNWIWRLSYAALHVFIFLLVVGMMDSDELLFLDRYNALQRAGTIVWFAYLGAGLQSIFLHSVPHLLKVPSTSWSSLYEVAVQFLLRLLVSMAFFTIEFLVVWLTIRQQAFSFGVASAFATREAYFYFVLLAALHITLFEIRANGASQRGGQDDEQATVLMWDIDGDSLASTEVSPLRDDASAGTSTPTMDMPTVFFSNSARPFSLGSVTASTASAYLMNIELELAKLMAAFEVLMIVCAACVLRSSIGFMWSRSAMLSLCIFIGVFLLVLLTSVGLFWSSGSLDDASMSTRFVNIGGCTTSKKLKYTAIDV